MINKIPNTINAIATHGKLYKYLSNTSSNKTPTIPAGTQATSILTHKSRISFFQIGLFLSFRFNGKIWFQNKRTTARIAPSWITTRNRFQNSSLTFSLTNSSRMIMWPVLLMGSHSVIPSTIPKNIALIISIMVSPFLNMPALHHKKLPHRDSPLHIMRPVSLYPFPLCRQPTSAVVWW